MGYGAMYLKPEHLPAKLTEAGKTELCMFLNYIDDLKQNQVFDIFSPHWATFRKSAYK